MSYFKDCIGAINETHVNACIPVGEQVPYIGRHGYISQNIMVVCDFDMTFTFVMVGWEGSAYDSRISHNAITDRRWNFSHPPPGNV
ncbi:hypothetical protein KSP39_PZI011350 [Platanthera zijinensis]|uniref:DDE Tnp4 domain-containing protein n=1 Tax=Platanthera zijinensis TaxID=2320716 RepID=A0AAP0BGI8_9ASPA